jgi:hypothetical protein
MREKVRCLLYATGTSEELHKAVIAKITALQQRHPNVQVQGGPSGPSAIHLNNQLLKIVEVGEGTIYSFEQEVRGLLI